MSDIARRSLRPRSARRLRGLLGIARRLIDVTVAYARGERFDRESGSFQAIKHMLADLM